MNQAWNTFRYDGISEPSLKSLTSTLTQMPSTSLKPIWLIPSISTRNLCLPQTFNKLPTGTFYQPMKPTLWSWHYKIICFRKTKNRIFFRTHQKFYFDDLDGIVQKQNRVSISRSANRIVVITLCCPQILIIISRINPKLLVVRLGLFG